MSLSLSALAARLLALEKKVLSLEEENALLRRAVLSAPAPAPASGKGKKVKSERAPRKTSPPSEKFNDWNSFVMATMKDMAEDAGVSYDSFMEEVDMEDEDAVKAAEAEWKKALKEVGIGRMEALKEASSRKKAAEAAEAPAAEEAEEKPVAKNTPARARAAVAPPPKKGRSPAAAAAPKDPFEDSASEEEAVDAELEERKRQFAEAGLKKIKVEGKNYYADGDNEVFEIGPVEYEIGARIGVLVKGKIDRDA